MRNFKETKCYRKLKKGGELRPARVERWSYSRRKSCKRKYERRKTISERKEG
jgi:hypothetical protein